MKKDKRYLEQVTHIDAVDFLLFRHQLIEWYQIIKRDLPWREDQDPYKVWVSEIMLQQTQVDTVIPYFNNFIEQFPTPVVLAEADEDEVLKAWEGLGYYSRARNLHAAVKEVAASYDGNVPTDKEQLQSLKGIGPYTLGAIMSIAYGEPEPAVDGNVMRVLSRVFIIDEDIKKVTTRKIFEALVRQLIDLNRPSDFNQGLMELGALICKPSQPKCDICPLKSVCLAHKEGIETTLPVKSKAKKQRQEQFYVPVIESLNGHVLIEKRPSEGLLANLYQFPMIEQSQTDIELLIDYVSARYQSPLEGYEPLLPVKHIFSHLIWSLVPIKFTTKTTFLVEEHQQWVKKDELSQFAFPVPHQKILQQL
ncbi:MAG: A/G-specific adenine glycosylase [Bacillota bacterium]